LLLSFCERLAAMPASIALHESSYLFLFILTVHVITLCVFVGMAVIMDLRLLGVVLPYVPASAIVNRLGRWAAGGFALMVASGSLLFFAAPVDRYQNVFFRIKLALIVLAGLNVLWFHGTTFRRAHDWDLDAVPPRAARVAGGTALLLWFAIIVAGRMIPYQQYWFD
jgi:hypothetical protein